MEVTEITLTGIAVMIIGGAIWVCRFLAVNFYRKFSEPGGVWDTAKGWGDETVKSLKETHQRLGQTTSGNAQSLLEMQSQTQARWKAKCDFMRAEVRVREDISDKSKSELYGHIDRIEESFTR